MCITFTPFVQAKDIGRIMYLKTLFAHIHPNPSKYSSTMTTLSCGHPVKVLEGGTGKSTNSKGWIQVVVGPYKGFIQGHFLSEKKVGCFQDKYPKLFDSFNLELSELYHWGRLYDLYSIGKSKIK